jgi:MYXO-CTERM domain-containing protein
MKTFIRNTLAGSFAVLLTTASVGAQNRDKTITPCGRDTGHACPANTPEIDPALGMGALALVGVGALAIRSRRKA